MNVRTSIGTLTDHHLFLCLMVYRRSSRVASCRLTSMRRCRSMLAIVIVSASAIFFQVECRSSRSRRVMREWRGKGSRVSLFRVVYLLRALLPLVHDIHESARGSQVLQSIERRLFSFSFCPLYFEQRSTSGKQTAIGADFGFCCATRCRGSAHCPCCNGSTYSIEQRINLGKLTVILGKLAMFSSGNVLVKIVILATTILAIARLLFTAQLVACRSGAD